MRIFWALGRQRRREVTAGEHNRRRRGREAETVSPLPEAEKFILAENPLAENARPRISWRVEERALARGRGAVLLRPRNLRTALARMTAALHIHAVVGRDREKRNRPRLDR